MPRFYPQQGYLQRRAAAASIALMDGKPLPRTSVQDIKNAKARREIERRRMEKEARE